MRRGSSVAQRPSRTHVEVAFTFALVAGLLVLAAADAAGRHAYDHAIYFALAAVPVGVLSFDFWWDR